VVEVNTRGIYKGRSEELFPGIDALKKIHSLRIPITLSSDAHKSGEINLCFDETKEILRKIGFSKLRLLTSNGQEDVDL